MNWQRVYYMLMSTIGIGILLWGGWSLLSQFVYAIVILLLSMAVAFLLTPAVNLLEKYHVPRLPIDMVESEKEKETTITR